MRKKRNKGKKIFLSILLFIMAFACLGGAGFFYLRLQENQQREVFQKYIEQLETENQDVKEETEPQMESMEETVIETEPETETVYQLPALPTEPVAVGEQTFSPLFDAYADENTILVGDTDILSLNALLIDLSNDRIVAKKGTDDKIYPASMTKILTILVAAEHMKNWDDTFTVTPEIINYSISHGCSAAGFEAEEVVPVKDLFYGTILPSGGEAAVSLATYIAGSHEAFVDMMNEKLEQLGLSGTAHFTNCVGIYDDNHYCTMKDVAMILKAAVENDFCREVLHERVYYIKKTAENPEGIPISNWFIRKIEDKDSGGLVTCAKTGFVEQSNCCAASYFVSNTGRPYICVTVDTYSEWRCIYDHVAMYKLYTE